MEVINEAISKADARNLMKKSQYQSYGCRFNMLGENSNSRIRSYDEYKSIAVMAQNTDETKAQAYNKLPIRIQVVSGVPLFYYGGNYIDDMECVLISELTKSR